MPGRRGASVNGAKPLIWRERWAPDGLWEHRWMRLSFIYLVFVSLLPRVGSVGPAQVNDIQLIVLRHQLDVLRRQVQCLKLDLSCLGRSG